MKYDEARYFVNEICNELNANEERFSVNVYRDGGSVDIRVKTDGYDNIVFVAPIAFGYGRKNACINTIQVLKKGCTKFEDIYNKDNILNIFSIDDSPLVAFDKNKRTSS